MELMGCCLDPFSAFIFLYIYVVFLPGSLPWVRFFALFCLYEISGYQSLFSLFSLLNKFCSSRSLVILRLVGRAEKRKVSIEERNKRG